MSQKKTSLKPRNRQAINPILLKGGCHQKTRSAERAADKRTLRVQVDSSQSRVYQ